eukprot:GILJ01019221.1.p1 GENE.GILJ01019221.1~~GILJ01019221.1.p1  ORF type:complete len:332 (+),score=22.33 GILJ01019221.1:63-1058(+)
MSVSSCSDVLTLGFSIVPNSFEEKLAKDLRVCPSTGKAVSISYHTFGDPSHPMLLLIPGLNTQGVANYESATCTWLAQQGFYVVRMDNRDVGLSTKFDDVPQKLNMLFYLLPHWLARLVGERQPYTLDDMADDASALIRHLAPGRKVHVLGVSMGGMIAQCIALRSPDLVASLTLIMTHTGNIAVSKTPLSTMLGFLSKPKSASVEHMREYRNWFVDTYLAGMPVVNRTLLDLQATESYARTVYRRGVIRHTTCVSRAPIRDESLKELAIPTHIVHGARDTVVPVGHGYHLHRMVKGSKLTVYPLMGHYIDSYHVQGLWDSVLAFVASTPQ